MKQVQFLLIEDSDQDALLLKRELDKAGLNFILKRLSRLDELASEIAFKRYDLILSDYHLVGFSADEVLAVIRAYDRNIPVIILSGAVGEETAAELMRNGASDFVCKDNNARLVPAIRRELEEASRREEACLTSAALFIAEDFNKRIIEASQDCIKVLDLSGNILSFSKAGLTALEISSLEDVIGKSYPSLWPNEEGRHSSVEAIDKARQGLTARFTGYGQSLSGKPLWWNIQMSPIVGPDGRVERLLAVSRDITEEKLREERAVIHATELAEALKKAESANEMKSAFLANMSHEIRTPVGAITGFASMLNHPAYTESDRRNFMMIIERNSRHLLRLIDDILDLSKVEAGKIVFENTDYNFNDFLTDMDALMSLRAAEKGISFHLKVHSPIPEVVHGDQLRLKQIFINIAGNAVKFTPKGSVTTEVYYDGGRLKIAFIDTGVGIVKENIGNLFQVFTQSDPSLTRKFGGTGLGLALSKRLAKQFGGDLVLEKTEFNKGSTFTLSIRLPLAEGSRMVQYSVTPKEEIPVPSPSEENGLLNGVTVVLVEDSPDNRVLISTYLKRTGVKLILAHDGREGYIKVMKNRPDIVLMDIQMPEMDGHEATRKLRANGFYNPIIALTAHAMSEERDRCFESGCSDYLTKPLQRERLVEAISRNVRNTGSRHLEKPSFR